MDRRTKTLMGIFGTAVACVVINVAVYPRWIKPLLTMNQSIAEKREEYARLKATQAEVRLGTEEYRAMVSRAGSFDIAKVETDIRDRLNRLIEKHQLQEANVSPSRPTKDRKTNIEKVLITVSAVGNLESVIGLLKDVAELPQLLRVSNPAIYPATSGRREQGPAPVNVRLPLEVLVLPQHKLVGTISPQDLAPPELFVRHGERDYSAIWQRRPFTEPVPLRLTVKGNVSVEQGAAATLSVTVTGGDQNYKFKWHPEKGLSDATAQNPTVNTAEPFSETYTVTATDGSGENASENVQVTVRERKIRPEPAKVEAPQPAAPKVVDKRNKDRAQMQLCMALMSRAGTEQSNELMVHNSKSRETTYHTVGKEFDGGELVFVHPRGGVVRRNGQYFIYPIGSRLDGDILVDEASAADYPELKEAVDRIREAEKTAAAANVPASPPGEGPGPAVAGGDAGAVDGAAAGARVEVTGTAPAQVEGQNPPAPAAVGSPAEKQGGAAVAGDQDSGNEKPKGVREPKATRRGTARPPRERKGKD